MRKNGLLRVIIHTLVCIVVRKGMEYISIYYLLNKNKIKKLMINCWIKYSS